MQETILWKRIDFPGHEICQLSPQNNGWKLSGTAVFTYNNLPCKLQYLILTRQDWGTDSVSVEGQIGDREVDLQIKSTNSTWRINEKEYPEVAGCMDIDLGFSPSTNTLPIRRLSIPVGGQENVKAAWLHFPTLELQPLDQVYTRESERTYRYESRGGDFMRRLDVRPSGFVQDYPGLWKFESAT